MGSRNFVAFSELGDRFGAEQTDSSKVGKGASLGAARRSDGQGAVVDTDNRTDLALLGNGLFVLKVLILQHPVLHAMAALVWTSLVFTGI